MFVQTPIRSTVLHDVAIQLPITQFFIGCIVSNDPLDRQFFVRQSPSSVQDDIGSDSPSLTCTLTSSSLDCDDLFRNLGPRALLQPPPGLEQLAPPSGLAIGSHLHTAHGASVTGLFLFLNRVLSFFLWFTLVNPNLKGILVLIQLTVISCIINFVFPFYNGTQARRANILLTLLLQPVGSSMRLFYRKPAIMLVFTDNTDLAILLNKDTFEPDPIVNSFKTDSTSKGT